MGEYICVTADNFELYEEEYGFSTGDTVEEDDHESAAEKYSRDIDDSDNEVNHDGRDIYVKCLETDIIKKFYVSVCCDPIYHASEIELGSKSE